MSKSPSPYPRQLAVGVVQFRAAESPSENLESALDGIRQAARDGAQVVCLQELFRTRYFAQEESPECFDLAEPIPGPTTEAIGKVAREHRVAVIAPVFERRAAGVYHNSVAVIDPDGTIAGHYRKLHIPHDPLFYEKYYFTPSDDGVCVVEHSASRFGVLICWDQWFPEAARLTALRGAEVIFYPTAIGWEVGSDPDLRRREREAWSIAQRAHAIANGVFVVAANRVGREGQLEFWGSSFVADPFGAIVAEAPTDADSTLVVTLDLGEVERVRRAWPFLRDRRVDQYAALTERWHDA